MKPSNMYLRGSLDLLKRLEARIASHPHAHVIKLVDIERHCFGDVRGKQTDREFGSFHNFACYD